MHLPKTTHQPGSIPIFFLELLQQIKKGDFHIMSIKSISLAIYCSNKLWSIGYHKKIFTCKTCMVIIQKITWNFGQGEKTLTIPKKKNGIEPGW